MLLYIHTAYTYISVCVCWSAYHHPNNKHSPFQITPRLEKFTAEKHRKVTQKGNPETSSSKLHPNLPFCWGLPKWWNFPDVTGATTQPHRGFQHQHRVYQDYPHRSGKRDALRRPWPENAKQPTTVVSRKSSSSWSFFGDVEVPNFWNCGWRGLCGFLFLFCLFVITWELWYISFAGLVCVSLSLEFFASFSGEKKQNFITHTQQKRPWKKSHVSPRPSTPAAASNHLRWNSWCFPNRLPRAVGFPCACW